MTSPGNQARNLHFEEADDPFNHPTLQSMKLLKPSFLSLTSTLASALGGPGATSPLFESLLALGSRLSPTPPHPLPLDLYEDDQNFIAVLEVPGIPKSDLHLEVRDRQIHVRIAKAPSESSHPEGPRLERSLPLLEGMNPESIAARLEDGVLILTLPKPSELRPTSIPVA
jgi:HSP20 family molecular chaperone IbpA